MANIFQSMSAEKSVFKDERYLQPDYLPDVLPHRENEINEIASALQSASRGGKPENLFIFGVSGTGKTCTVKYVLNQLKEYSDSALPIYVNCWQNGTRLSIVNKIAIALSEVIPRRGISYDEAMERIVEVIKKEEKIPIVVLDEVDRLLANKEEEILYDLSRAYEMNSIPVGMICISNREDTLAFLDRRIKSSLAARELTFKPYNQEQLKDILKERARYAFVTGACDDAVLSKCAEIGVKKGGDARFAINLLWLAGKGAEKENVNKVSEKHVLKMAMEEQISAEGLTSTEKEILNVLKEKGTLKSSELYSELEKKGIAERTVRKYIERLEQQGKIKTETIEERGKWRNISLVK